VVPHITDEIKRNIFLLGETGEYDFIITEIGGSVGDIESLPFVEAVRQVRWDLGSNNALVIHLTLIPYLKAAKELKTKPTQHSVKELFRMVFSPIFWFAVQSIRSPWRSGKSWRCFAMST
jgi:CTP synthase